ncbi:ThuA domain-containing protein [Aquibacillus koreensis]|uniref:ThuA domain-containing protein n=1 Tax=Aquibacillus koreensis TaxID=279446 RepID=A0A9X3WMT6_9BACI|nr:ThuA domain-containing protein [Aquibacillus koreensis]MCT2537889.1 ThuA domain-containing protein [Aquibacillus koreensis]MDC3422657.1 ThuA domain-containing protein [Aquibacillus koreensis]
MAKRIVAVLGDFYHKREWSERALEAAVEPLEDIKIEYKSREELVESLDTNPDAVILFAENRINPEDEQVNTWMDDDAAEAIQSYVQNGGGWLAWHSGLASYDHIKGYTDMLHGFFKFHPQQHQQVTYTVKQPTDLIKDTEQFTFLDEHYFVECDEDNTNVFLTTESVDGASIGGWEHDFGKGHVISFVPAHLEEGLMDPAVQEMLMKAIKRVSE